MKDTDETFGTLIVDAGAAGKGWTPLGLPGQTDVTIPDDVILRGNRTQVSPEHAGMHLTFSRGLTISAGVLLQVDGTLDVQQVMAVDASTVVIDSLTATELSLSHGSVLTTFAATTARMHKLDVEVSGTLTVDGDSVIDVSGKGYLPGRTTGNTTTGGATGNSGGSYGGLGGASNGVTNAVYGDYLDPQDWGSGGGNLAGGGLVEIQSGSLVLDGQLLADGVTASGGAGSGGGILVSTSTLSGVGSISAAGGASTSGHGSGGGGRVAVYAPDFSTFDTTQITALGGTGGNQGAAGTVYIVNGPLPFRVRDFAPHGANGNNFGTLDHVDLTFSQYVDAATVVSETIEIKGPLGRIDPTGILQLDRRSIRINFAPPTENGIYHVTVLPAFRNAQGGELDQNRNGIAGEPDDSYSVSFALDTIGARLTQHTPAGDVAGTLDHVDVWFSEAIDTTTFTTGDVAITKPNGQVLAASSIQQVGFNRFRIGFAGQTLVGTYHVVVGPDVRDLAGNQLDQDQDGQRGEAGQDTFDATVHLVAVDLELSNLVVHTAPLFAGETVEISWAGRNATGVALSGNWTDAVYLSADDQWDINDQRLGTVQHTGGLVQDATYSGDLTAYVPGTLPGDYHILVRADVFNQEREGSDEADNVIASFSLAVGVHGLVGNGAASSGVLTSGSRSHYYAIHINGSNTAGLVLNGLVTSGVSELYVSLDAIPTRISYDLRAAKTEFEPNRGDQQLAFTAPPGGGTFYILVYGDQIDGYLPYELSATTGSFVVTTMTPDIAPRAAPTSGDAGPVKATVTVTGAGFTSDFAVEFIAPDASIRVPARVNLVSMTTVTLEMALADWPLGVYDVRFLQGSRIVERAAAFTVVEQGTPHLETRLIVPDGVASLAVTPQTIWIEYKNTGNAPMPAPLLTVVASSPQHARITADRGLAYPFTGYQYLAPSVTDTARVIGTGSGATPGILQPGDSGRIPIYYFGLDTFGHFPVSFNLTVLTAADTVERVFLLNQAGANPQIERLNDGRRTLAEPITISGNSGIFATVFEQFISMDWSAITANNRPASFPEDAWLAIASNLHADIGNLWADYVLELSEDANYLATLGLTTQDVDKLWNYEIAQASASLNPVSTLAGAVDAAVATPGLSLSFTRVFGESILARYRQGALGRGWANNWDIRAELQTNGDVVLRGPGGVDRFFTLDRGVYVGAAGDHGVLTSTGDGFRVTETDKTVWQFRADGLLDFVQDTNGNKITLAYDGAKQLTTLTHSNGKQLLISYNAAGHIASVADPIGPGAADDRVTTYEYDDAGEHLIRVTAPGNRVTQYAYDSGDALPTKHALLSVGYADGTHDYFNYDSRGRLAQTSRDGDAQTVNFAYGNAGQVTVTDGTGRPMHLAYGLNGRLEQVRDADGRTVDFVNCDCGHVTQITGPEGERYNYTYDANGNLTAVQDPLRKTTTFHYDTTFNRLTGFTDARGNGMDYAYDAKGNLTRITYEDGTHEDYTYDSKGNVLSSTNRRGQTITFTYNIAGQVLTKDDSTTAGVEFVYA
ncbi:MAG: hypothetical protein ACKV0T_11760 [Planctomycetales bacterium]